MPESTENNENRPKNGNKRHLFSKLKRRSKYFYLKILRIDDPPERIARGAAIGVLMGILPTFGVGGLLSIGLAFILKANKASAIIGSFIMNPITGPFFWSMSIVLGSLIMREDYRTMLATMKEEGWLTGAGHTYLVFLVGNVLISAVFTVASYYVVKAFIIRHRRRKEEKRLKKLSGRV